MRTSLAALLALVLAAQAAAVERRAILVQYAAGLAGPLVERHGWAPEDIRTVEVPDGRPIHHESFEKALAEHSAGLAEGDFLLVAACVHAAPGALFYEYPLARLEDRLKPCRADVVLLLDVCHSGAALEIVPSAASVLAACKAEEKTPGAYITLLRRALEDPAPADSDGDGLTWAEAHAWACDPGRLAEEFRRIHRSSPEFWPFDHGPAPVARGLERLAVPVGPRSRPDEEGGRR